MLKFQGFQRFRLQKYSKYSTVLKIKILETVEISRIWWWMIRGSNPGHPARLTPYYKVLQDAVRCYLVMLHCSDCNGYKALATGYNTK
jgi:hypothetical protein